MCLKMSSGNGGHLVYASMCYMMTSSNGNIFRVTGPLCGEFTGPGEFPTQRPVTRSFDVFFDLRLNKRLNKQSWGWWFETPSWSLWRHCNEPCSDRMMPNKGHGLYILQVLLTTVGQRKKVTAVTFFRCPTVLTKDTLATTTERCANWHIGYTYKFVRTGFVTIWWRMALFWWTTYSLNSLTPGEGISIIKI